MVKVRRVSAARMTTCVNGVKAVFFLCLVFFTGVVAKQSADIKHFFLFLRQFLVFTHYNSYD